VIGDRIKLCLSKSSMRYKQFWKVMCSSQKHSIKCRECVFMRCLSFVDFVPDCEEKNS
jgi:hypothetical protein